MGSTPLVKFIREHIRDSGDVFCISSLVKVSSFSIIKLGLPRKYSAIFCNLQKISEMFSSVRVTFGQVL